MIHIGSGYRHYEDLINRIGEERIKARYEFLHEQMLQFIAGFDRERNGIGNRLSINEHALMHAILEYFEDIEKVKSKLDYWLRFPYGALTGQIHYSKIKPLILAENYLEQSKDKDILPF